MRTADVVALLSNEFSARRERNRRARNRALAFAIVGFVATTVKLVIL